jgi:hypothetical protein
LKINKDWLYASSPGNITLETFLMAIGSYTKFATLTYIGSFQIGFQLLNSKHAAVDSKTKLIILAEDSSDRLFSFAISTNDYIKNIMIERKDCTTRINGSIDILSKKNLENTKIKTDNWIYFGDDNTHEHSALDYKMEIL